MPLVTTPGAADANSYLSVAEADSRAQADLGRFATRWLDSTKTDNPRKEAALQRATADIDAHLGYQEPYSILQALRFPRLVDQDSAGSPLIPDAIERATYLQAVYVNANAELIDDSATRRSRGLSSFSEPNVSGQLMETATPLSPRVLEVLEGFSQGTGGSLMAPIVKEW